MMCHGCSLIGCQKHHNPPAGCLIPDDRKVQAGYGPMFQRWGRQEQKMRMDACETGD